MGVLEDAIRQHLDLKRQHGASEEELDSQESEALGASQREAEEAAAAETEAAAAEAEAAEGAAGQQHAEADVEHEQHAEADGEHEQHAEADGEHKQDAEELMQEPAADTSSEPAGAEPPLEEPDEAPAAERLEPPPAVAGEPEGEGEPFGFDEAEPGVAPPMPVTGEGDTPSGGTGEAGDSEDVLEETPEFLQETPEHDRLWFEQKPPRDFDFD